jgi:hypothetical protein
MCLCIYLSISHMGSKIAFLFYNKNKYEVHCNFKIQEYLSSFDG